MWILFSVLAAAVFLGLLCAWCLKGRTGHPGLAELRGWSYAHRGLHDAQRPENSMAAFRAAVESGYGAELDIHLMKDGNLAVIHDSSLKRTAGVDLRIEDLDATSITAYHLNNTQEQIPLLPQVLEIFEGRAPLIVELKTVNRNHAAICRAASQLLDNYHGQYCIESFDPRVVAWFRRHRPDVIRGQLSENWMRAKLSAPSIFKWVMTHHIANVYTRPDFIACRFEDRNVAGTKICRGFWKVQGVSWTIRTIDDFKTAVDEGWIPIFEGFVP